MALLFHAVTVHVKVSWRIVRALVDFESPAKFERRDLKVEVNLFNVKDFMAVAGECYRRVRRRQCGSSTYHQTLKVEHLRPT